MGKKKTKTQQTNKPVYSSQIEGAANTANQAYNAQAPAIADISNQFLGVSGNLLDQYNSGGNPATEAAQNYITSTLGQEPGNNPYLDDIVGLTNENLARDINTHLGTRGNLGGSVQSDILARELGRNELGLRYEDYNNQENRQANAAGLAPSVSAASYLPIDQALQTGRFGAFSPLDAATQNAVTTGGLLGQYQNVNGTQTQSGGLLGQILQGGSLFLGGRR